jgi:hypothetical protein
MRKVGFATGNLSAQRVTAEKVQAGLHGNERDARNESAPQLQASALSRKRTGPLVNG